MSSATKFAIGPLIALAAGCASTSIPGPPATIEIAFATPPRGTKIRAETVIEVSVDYEIREFQAGKHSIAALVKTRGGKFRESTRKTLTNAKGRVVFALPAGPLLSQSDLARPLQVGFLVDHVEPGRAQHPRSTRWMAFEEEETESDEAKRKVKFVSADVGHGQLVTDFANDARYRPRLPKHLNLPGNVVSGVFKVCVDTEGEVFRVGVVKSAHQDVDDSWKSTLLSLKYRPYTVSGEPMPFCYPMKVEVLSTF